MPDVIEPAATFAELLLRRADDDRVALLAEDLAWTWRELIAHAGRRAAVMSEMSFDGPRHVGVLLENTPEYVAWIYGAALARTTIVGINPTRRGEALAQDIRHTDCDVIVTDRERHGLIAGLDLSHASDRTLLVDSSDFADRVRQAEPTYLAADPADRLLLLFTSGSTGAPKAVICTTGRLARTSTGAVQSLGIRPDDVLYQAMPLFHGNAIMANLAPALALAAPVALRRRFSASQFLTDVRRYDATYFNYVGRSLAYVLATPRRPDDHENSLRLGFGTEASMRDRAEFTDRFGCDLLETYGSSEGVIATYRPPGAPPNSIGMPQPRPGSDVAVVDASTSTECPRAVFGAAGGLVNGDEAIGEIVDRGGAVGFEGYYRNEAATTERIRDGWYWTGDLAYRDDAGYFYFAGRSLDWLRVDSENFAAAPVEAVISRHPDVVMAAVYAVPDPRTGDQVMAALELRAGATFDPAGFAAFLKQQADLGTKWAPRFVRIVAAMPLTATNKVDKAPLRRAQWDVDGEVFERTGSDISYEVLTRDARAELRAAFGRHGRTDLLPS
ncbi:MAG: AMP-binding protein [Frankiaceae bacterium]|nr:AMP-binding protein [Frankiaceae bacterium]MBV9870057.1 AMP-binding protein [Frankiaceae bacterium]